MVARFYSNTGSKKDEPFILLLFSSWQATHDAGHSGINLENYRRAVKKFSKFATVYIPKLWDVKNIRKNSRACDRTLKGENRRVSQRDSQSFAE